MKGKEYKLQFPDLIQPKDRTHPLYQLLDQFIIDGDQKEIALKFDISEGVVSNVKCGRERSKRVWDQLIVKMMRRKKEQDRVLAYMTTPIAQKAA